MGAVSVTLGMIGPRWTFACKQAVTDLNTLFRRSGINVLLLSTALVQSSQ
jgi:hypothetical protein